jgi:putative glutamine amidotransferase
LVLIDMPPPSSQASRRPLVAVPACRKFIAPHPFHAVGEKYVNAVATAAGALPLLVPPLGGALGIRDLLGRVDGLMLTGSPSNVEPHHYAGPRSREGTAHDPHRDHTTLPLIDAAVAAGMPVLALCRGFQEVNVALGGSLHQNVQELPGMLDHRENGRATLEQQYAPSHDVQLTPGGLLAKLAGCERVRVNSLHAQGVDRLAEALSVEATASDGLVEAYRIGAPDQFLLAVQWHPEWRVLEDPLSRAIFESFGAACRRYSGHRSHEPDRELV